MSLAPWEQRILARIEHMLHSSDPKLSRMLATFTLPAFRGGIRHVLRLRIKDFLPPAVAMVMISGIICCGLLLGHASRGDCALRGIALASVTTCQPATAHPPRSG